MRIAFALAGLLLVLYASLQMGTLLAGELLRWRAERRARRELVRGLEASRVAALRAIAEAPRPRPRPDLASRSRVIAIARRLRSDRAASSARKPQS